MEYGIIQKRRRRKATSLNWEYLWTFNLPSTPRMILYTYMTVYDIVYIYIYSNSIHGPLITHFWSPRDLSRCSSMGSSSTCEDLGCQFMDHEKLAIDPSKMWIYHDLPIQNGAKKSWQSLDPTAWNGWDLLGFSHGQSMGLTKLRSILWLISCGKIGIESCEMTSEYWKWLCLRTWSSKNCFASENTGFSRNKIANLESIWEENTYRWLIGVTISMTIYHVWGKHQLLVQSNSVYSSGADGVPEVWNPTHGLIGHPEAGADLLTWECSMWLPHEIHWYSMHLKVPMLGCSKNVEHCGKRAL